MRGPARRGRETPGTLVVRLLGDPDGAPSTG